jgi:hypothetical protein
MRSFACTKREASRTVSGGHQRAGRPRERQIVPAAAEPPGSPAQKHPAGRRGADRGGVTAVASEKNSRRPIEAGAGECVLRAARRREEEFGSDGAAGERTRRLTLQYQRGARQCPGRAAGRRCRARPPGRRRRRGRGPSRAFAPWHGEQRTCGAHPSAETRRTAANCDARRTRTPPRPPSPFAPPARVPAACMRGYDSFGEPNRSSTAFTLRR